MLKAMGQARFSVFQGERPHETAGLLVRDLMREEDRWLVDENLERTGPVGLEQFRPSRNQSTLRREGRAPSCGSA